ncbi:MAG: hypothetical protein HDQ95_05840 [Roseburia sp.]|nr:hypothetical protein [Roseburia sp.]
MTVKFNVYQARNGAICISSGSSYTKLSKKQIEELRICVYDIEDFDYEDFKRHYENEGGEI